MGRRGKGRGQLVVNILWHIYFFHAAAVAILSRTSISPASERRKESERAKTKWEAAKTNEPTNEFLLYVPDISLFSCGCCCCELSDRERAVSKGRKGEGVRKVGMCVQGCHQWQQPSNVARKPTRCSIHFRFGLASFQQTAAGYARIDSQFGSCVEYENITWALI